MRIVFMGTPEIAQVALSELLIQGHEVVGVFTREDKPVGRKQVITPSPVKRRAVDNRLPVFQPKTLKDPEVIETVRELAPELIVVVAYGRVLPPEILEIPPYGCINLHVSLLPKYRGAAPIQWAVMNGETETGVSIMQMDEGVDTGPVIAQRKISISPTATSGEVFELVTSIGSRFLGDVVEDISKGQAQATPQEGEPSYAPPLGKGHGKMDFTRPAQQLHNLVRGCNPWPLAWFDYGDKRIKVLRSRVSEECGAPGEIARANPLTICCGEGSLILDNVTPAGSKAMSGAEWAVGRRFKAGDKLL